MPRARSSSLARIRTARFLASAMVVFGTALASLLGLSLTGCSGSASGPSVAAPSTLTYGLNPATYTRNLAIAGNVPHQTGGLTASFTIAPALPAGLSLNGTSGVISGTPTALSPQTAYAVTAANAGGSATCYLLLAVNDPAPTNLAYPQQTLTCTKDTALPVNVPTVAGGAVTRFLVSPELPKGLALDLATGAISGTPTVVAATATYRVTASNSGGSVSFALTLTVNDAPPRALVYGTNPATYFAGVEILPNKPSHDGGAVISYQISPALPAGLNLNAVTGEITGLPVSVSGGRLYTVTALNSGGGTTCALSIVVNAVPPSRLAYADRAPVYTRGVAIPDNVPSYAGGTVLDYAISPALPAGLRLDPVTGTISGTPAVVSPATTYTVTATNSGGATEALMLIAVREGAPTGLAYATNPTAYTVNVAIQPNLPSNGGGAVTAYAVNPALPAGLSLNTTTGVISGTPTAVTPQASYLITGSNSTASTTCTFVTAVVASAILPPAAPVVTVPGFAASGQTALQASTQDQGAANGLTYLWTLGNGTITGGQGTRAITFTAGTVGTLNLEVKVTNLGGSVSGTGTVTIVAPPEARIFAQDKALYGTRVQASVADQPGMTYLWTLSGASAGTILSGTTSLATYTAGLTPGSYQLHVSVQSPTGAVASATRTLQVVAAQFLLDAQTSRQRLGHTLTTLLDGRILVAGGDDPKGAALPSADLYDPHSGTWAPTGSMGLLRAYHAAALLPDGKVLVTGGTDPSGTMTETAEIYDPLTNAWTSAPAMSATRQSHTATALVDGRILVAGGFGLDQGGSIGGYLASAELYDPVAKTWETLDPMQTPRSNHTATVLQNGQVLMAAGARGTSSSGWVQMAEIFDPALKTWTSAGSLATARFDHTATLLPSGKVFVAGGRSLMGAIADGELFDPATSTWTVSSNHTTSGHINHAAALLPSGKVLVIGGSDEATQAKVDSYDPATNRWTAKLPLSHGRYGAQAVLLATGKVLVLGGRGDTPQTMGNPELYDPAGDLWSTTGIQDSSRSAHTATRLQGGSLLVAGGTGARSYLAGVEKYDPATGSWTAAASLNQARCYHTASLLADGRVLVAAGLGTTGSATASAEVYAPSTNTWTVVGSLATARLSHTATVLGNGKILVVGGFAGATTLATAELFDPATGLWSAAASLSTARGNHTATLLANGKVLVAGGGSSSTFSATTELYDPATDTWTAKAAMFAPRANHSATQLPDGTVLVVAGQSDSSFGIATIERYDPAANVWTALVGLNAARYVHAAALLSDGRLLVTGGRSNTNRYEHTAELYDPSRQTSLSIPMSVVRAYHTATVLDAAGTVLVLGGTPGSTPEFWKP